MDTYIVTWSVTLEAESADIALAHAELAMAEGNITPDVELADDTEAA